MKIFASNWYKDATWTDYGQQLHWRQLSAYNVVESVASNTTSRCIFCIFYIFCFVFVARYWQFLLYLFARAPFCRGREGIVITWVCLYARAPFCRGGEGIVFTCMCLCVCVSRTPGCRPNLVGIGNVWSSRSDYLLVLIRFLIIIYDHFSSFFDITRWNILRYLYLYFVLYFPAVLVRSTQYM